MQGLETFIYPVLGNFENPQKDTLVILMKEIGVAGSDSQRNVSILFFSATVSSLGIIDFLVRTGGHLFRFSSLKYELNYR